MKSLKILFLIFSSFCFSQDGFQLIQTKKTVIPFQLINNLIFVPVNINGVNLTFLLDSGVNETILFSLEEEEISFNDVEKIKFAGLGESKDIEGLRSDRNTVSIGKKFRDDAHTIFIILDESINFSSHVGIPVNGIIGFHFFKNHPVQIDYARKKITIFESDADWKNKKNRFTEFLFTLEGNKPYLQTEVEMTTTKTNSKMLIDLGNSDALWLFPKLIPDFEYNRPNIEDFLGRGFNGDIFGKRSRIHRFYLGEFVFEKPLTAMPDEYSIQNLNLVPDRKGSVGSEILRRFTLLFDYPNEKLYLKKNTHFKDPFLFNNSGLDVQQDGLTWEKDVVEIKPTKRQNAYADGDVVYQADKFKYNFILKPKFSVAACRKNSPCDVAGIKKNDRLIKINNQSVSNMKMQKINDYFKDEDGKKLKVSVERDDQILNFTLILVDPIRYQDEN